MDTGVITVEELREELRHDRRAAWVRLLLGAERNGVALVRYGQVVIGGRPAGWGDRRWIYPGWTFATTKITARTFAGLLTAGPAQEIKVGDVTCSFALGESAGWHHHASHQEYAGIEVPWPSRSVTLSLDGARENVPGGYLVGSAGPSFPTFAGAYAAFFYDRWVQSGVNQATLGQVDLRIVDGRARIRRAVVHAASIDVWVDGPKAKGCRLELNSSAEQLEVEVTYRGKVTVLLRAGLGQDPWLWLKDDTGWVDFRALRGWGGRQSPDVEFETPADPVAELTALATQGESTFLEYKQELPDDTAASKRKVLKTVVAFANGDGGTILFGVDGDDDAGAVVGLAGKPAVLLRRLNSLVRDRVTPAPAFALSGLLLEGKYVIRLEVSSGGGTLHALVLDANHPEYYVRRNGSTYYARPEELAEVATRRVQDRPHGLWRLP